MAVPLLVNGIIYQYPQTGDTNWGPVLTAWSTAVTNGMLQKAGGSFPLTAEVNFGTAFGIATLYIKSTTLPIATTGFLRLQNTAGLVWRNAANSANLILTVDASNQLTFNGVPIAAASSLTNGHIFVGNVSNQPADVAMMGDITITNTGVTSIGAGVITNTQINTAAAIALTKLAATSPYFWYTANGAGVLTPIAVTANRSVITDSNGLPTASATTSTEISYSSGVTSSIQAQLNALAALGSVPTGAISDFAGTAPPSGWLVCDGSAISRSTYSALFSAIGITWGSGDGSTTFNIPALSRRASVGSGGSGTGVLGNAVGNLGGSETITLSSAQMPSHTHTATVTDPLHNHTERVAQAGGGTPLGVQSVSFNGVNVASALTTGNVATGITVANANTGGGGSHDNIQPSAVVLKIIKT